jgi:hypothetical protein
VLRDAYHEVAALLQGVAGEIASEVLLVRLEDLAQVDVAT